MSSHSKRAILSFCAALCLFLCVPLYAVYLSLNDINFSVRDFFLISLIITLIASSLFYITSTLLAKIKFQWLAFGALYFIIFWSSISGLIFPLAAPAGMISPEELPINFVNLVLTGTASVLLTLLTYTKLKPATHIFVLILMITSLGSAATSLYETGSSPSRFSELSKTDNVIVLSFDGLAGVVAKQVIEENPDLKSAFRDFQFYDNALSLAPATTASLRSEVYGNINFRALSPDSKELQKQLIDKTNSIAREHHLRSDVMTYGMYSMFNPASSDVIVPGTIMTGNFNEKVSLTLSFYPHIAARVATPVIAAIISEEVRTIQLNYLRDRKAERAANHKGASWDALSTLQSDELVALTQNLHSTNSPRNVRYMHFLHTHFPVDLDEKCQYRSDNAEWFNSNQNYQGLINETHCALKQTADFIDKLRALGLYEKTLLVVKSDHGATADYFNDAPSDNNLDGIQFNGNALWGYNRYRPLLMIKPYSAANNTIEYNHQPASLSDLARTLCEQSPDPHSCREYKGLNLLDPTEEDSAPTLYMDVVKDESSTFDFDTQITINLPRSINFEQALKKTGKVILDNPSAKFKQRKSDLDKIHTALEHYHDTYGAYPQSSGFDGILSDWGRSSENWVSGLVPDFIEFLPRDPDLSATALPQYLYWSNGTDYKLIAHGTPQSCSIASQLNPEMVDPVRQCYAFGFWSKNAQAR
ncbi:sulfatase-like hydrolase/transferase [Pseudomonas veronii]|uniref:sulfatase-like hydrolase/transferase n=1 Tax=Pseudomonas veronii TaxID=76761 RepID=UPI00143DE0DA|nr:sulfatase-like hydrolase/transferase [Pseudomonas veronii]